MAFGLQKVLPQLSQQFFIVRALWNSAQPRVSVSLENVP